MKKLITLSLFLLSLTALASGKDNAIGILDYVELYADDLTPKQALLFNDELAEIKSDIESEGLSEGQTLKVQASEGVELVIGFIEEHVAKEKQIDALGFFAINIVDVAINDAEMSMDKVNKILRKVEKKNKRASEEELIKLKIRKLSNRLIGVIY